MSKKVKLDYKENQCHTRQESIQNQMAAKDNLVKAKYLNKPVKFLKQGQTGKH